MELFEMTSANLFIRPLFGIPVKVLDEFDFKNAYIKDEIKGMEYPHCIYLLFRPKNQEKFNEFVEGERQRGVLVDEYDYAEGYTMLVYRYHEKWKEDILLINAGKFSEVSTDYKNEIPDKAGEQSATVMSIQYHVFLKTAFIKGLWKEKYNLDITDKDEHWPHYTEREIFSEETFKRIK